MATGKHRCSPIHSQMTSEDRDETETKIIRNDVREYIVPVGDMINEAVCLFGVYTSLINGCGVGSRQRWRTGMLRTVKNAVELII